jgi:hypothetical protein
VKGYVTVCWHPIFEFRTVRVFFTIICLLVVHILHAQSGAEGLLTIKGKVTDAGTGEPMEIVAVVNTTTQQLVYTDAKGLYQIGAHPGETIAANYLGYRQMLVPISSGSELIPVNITLRRQNFQMPELVVRPKYTPYQADSISRRSTYQRTLIRGHEGSIGSPITLLAEKISKKSKQRFRFQKDFARLENERFIETRYSPEVVTQMTYLTGDSLAHFMNQYPMPVDYARTASELELKMWIRLNFREWKSKGMPMPGLRTDSVTVKSENKE